MVFVIFSDLNGCEALTGSAAVSQQHKNPSNTFDDVRKLLSNPENPSISVPALDKEVLYLVCASAYIN